MTRDIIIDNYFKWLISFVYDRKVVDSSSFTKLLFRLHETEFRYSMLMDENRAEDGIGLRWRYASNLSYAGEPDMIMDILEGPCSVLEMMVALALHCEEGIMDDTRYGNRTEQWFWGMIVNLGLGGMTNKNFDRDEVDEILSRCLNREYKPDGTGGLFKVKNCERDMRKLEIWQQLSLYLNTIT